MSILCATLIEPALRCARVRATYLVINAIAEAALLAEKHKAEALRQLSYALKEIEGPNPM